MFHDLQKLTDAVGAALARPLPGQPAQMLMAPSGRTIEVPGQAFRPGAVVIVLCQAGDGNIFIPLTERHQYKGVHSGQVSLPGGKFDAEDADLAATAVRECAEEIGINTLTILGKLSQLYIPVSGFMVEPFVAVCPVREPVMTTHEREVKRILKLPLTDLLDGDKVIRGSIEVNGMKIRSPYWELDGAKVWGATAMILSEFSEVLRALSGIR